jgi:hypothetical protein
MPSSGMFYILNIVESNHTSEKENSNTLESNHNCKKKQNDKMDYNINLQISSVYFQVY